MLYRTPNVIIDGFEWHAVVSTRRGRGATLTYRFRPVSIRDVMWQSIPLWKGPKPVLLLVRFAKYRRHIDDALVSEARRKEAAVSLQRRGRMQEEVRAVL